MQWVKSKKHFSQEKLQFGYSFIELLITIALSLMIFALIQNLFSRTSQLLFAYNQPSPQSIERALKPFWKDVQGFIAQPKHCQFESSTSEWMVLTPQNPIVFHSPKTLFKNEHTVTYALIPEKPQTYTWVRIVTQENQTIQTDILLRNIVHGSIKIAHLMRSQENLDRNWEAICPLTIENLKKYPLPLLVTIHIQCSTSQKPISYSRSLLVST